VRDAHEVMVAAEWGRVLGRSPASVDEDFFDAGGSSLAAASLVAGLRRMTGHDVGLAIAFDGRTVRGMAASLRREPAEHARLVPLSWTGEGPPLVLMPSGGGTLVRLEVLARVMDRPMYGLVASGMAAGDGTPFRTLTDVLDDFVDLLESSALPRTVHLGGFCLGGTLAYAVTDRLAALGWTVRSVQMLNTSLAVPPNDPGDDVRARIVEYLQIYGVTADPADARATFAALRRHGVDLVEEDYEAWHRRILVAAGLWAAAAGYEPSPIAPPVRLLASPDRNDPADIVALGSRYSDWTDVPDLNLEVIDVPMPAFEAMRDEDVMTDVVSALRRADSV
jgi:hypothetical protein